MELIYNIRYPGRTFRSVTSTPDEGTDSEMEPVVVWVTADSEIISSESLQYGRVKASRTKCVEMMRML